MKIPRWARNRKYEVIGRAGLELTNENVDESQQVGQQVGQLSSIEHLELALHHLSLASEHALAKEVLLRLIKLRADAF